MVNTKIKKIIDSDCNNVAIFVDYDNIYYGLSEYGINLENERFDIFHIMNELYEFDKIRVMKAFADFEQIKVSLRHLQEKRVQIHNVYGNNAIEKNRKNASDIELSINAIETCYNNPNIDTFVFITSDSDMIPIMSKMLFYGKKVHLYSIKENTNKIIDNYCNLAVDLIELLDIDTRRKQPEFWIEDFKKIFIEFYENPNNKSKILTNKWLIERIQQKIYMSYGASVRLIQSMLDLGVIEKTESNQFYGYKLKED